MAPRRRTIPLQHRLPNATATHVGREAERAWLADALERTPLVVVRGPGGIGKTSLVLHTLATCFKDMRRRTLYLPIPPDEPADQVRIDLAHLLAAASGARDSAEIAGLGGDPEELVALALDLAEEGPFWVVIDDLQHSDLDEMGELARQLASYAHESRWIVTTRALRDDDALEGRVLDLDRMAPGALAELARALAPEHPDPHAAVGACAGSPWLLKQYLATGASGLALTRAGILEGLSGAARELLRTLVILGAATPAETLASLVALPPPPELEALARRGLLLSSGAGYEVHDQVAELLFPPAARPEEAPLRERLARALGALGDPDSVLQAARLLRSNGAVPELVDLLDQHGHELLAAGQAPRVWAVIAELTDPRLGLWKLRCATELGNSTVLAAVSAPADRSPSDALAWATAQLLLGDATEAQRLAQEIAAETEDEGLRVEAGLLSARVDLMMERPERAAATLAGLRPTPAHAFRVEAARCHLEARTSVPGAHTRIAGLLAAAGADPEGLLDLAHAQRLLGDREGADLVVGRVLASPRGGRTSLLVARRAALLRARLRLDAGDLPETERQLERVRPFVRGLSVLRPSVIALDVERRLAQGDHEHLEAVLERGLDLAQTADLGAHRALEALSAELRRRRGGGEGDPSDPLAEARAWTGAGQAERAVDAAQTLRRRASNDGLRVRALEASIVVGEALLASGRRAELAEVVAALETLAEALGSARAAQHAAFFEGFDRVATLERLARDAEIAPVVARRCRALLGAEARLDVVDHAIVQAASEAWRGRAISMVVTGAAVGWSAAWGLDASRQTIWLPDGREISLQRKPLLWRILETLAARGGAAGKEELVLEAWGEADYHPGRHDGKLHVAIRTLRRALEEDASQPTRLLTVEDGYRLGGTVRRVS
ncbi:MAG: AAA family ATPase [Myxococcota bacterium]|nr:AAA family ATPase [Myxococcota bacterium]